MRLRNTIVAILLLSLATSCQTTPKVETVMFVPKAELGYQKNVCVMHIVDEFGEDYVIEYKLFNTLFVNGYNSVIEYYYSQPADKRIQPVDGFYASKAKDATQVKDLFLESYIKTETLVWHPTLKVRIKAMKIRRQLYGLKYQPSSAKPTIK